jgi:hypothetical protein
MTHRPAFAAHHRRLLAGAALAAALAACGGDDGDALLGMWQVTAHTANETSCDAEGPAVAEPTFIKFIEGDFFGQEYLEYVACTDATGATCDEPGGIFFSLLYSESIDDGMRAEIFASSGTADDCLLSATTSDATVSGSTLRIETRHRREDNVTGTACTPDDAQARADSMPCAGLEVLTGARL